MIKHIQKAIKKIKTNTGLAAFLNFVFLAYVLFFILDLYGSDQTSAKFLLYSAKDYLWYVVATLLFLKIFLNFSIHKKIGRVLSSFVLPTTSLLTLVLSVLEHYSPSNAVYAMTRLHMSQLGALSLFLLILWLLGKSKSWWTRHYDEILAIAPLYMFVALLVVRTWPFNYFLVFVQEDHFIEYAQFWVLLLGSIWLGYLAYKAKVQKKTWFIRLNLFLAFSLFLVAGDEISWGQRLLGAETPDFINYYNRQGEITIHNLKGVDWLVKWGYLTISWLGLLYRVLLGVFQRFIKNNQHLLYFAPHISVTGFFLFPALFHTINFVNGFGICPEWAEPMELFFYAGLVFWFGLSSAAALCSDSQNKRSAVSWCY